MIISPKRRNTLLKGFGRRNLSQLLKCHAFSAETEKGMITASAACAKRIAPALTIPEGPLGPSTINAQEVTLKEDQKIEIFALSEFKKRKHIKQIPSRRRQKTAPPNYLRMNCITP